MEKKRPGKQTERKCLPGSSTRGKRNREKNNKKKKEAERKGEPEDKITFIEKTY